MYQLRTLDTTSPPPKPPNHSKSATPFNLLGPNRHTGHRGQTKQTTNWTSLVPPTHIVSHHSSLIILLATATATPS